MTITLFFSLPQWQSARANVMANQQAWLNYLIQGFPLQLKMDRLKYLMESVALFLLKTGTFETRLKNITNTHIDRLGSPTSSPGLFPQKMGGKALGTRLSGHLKNPNFTSHFFHLYFLGYWKMMLTFLHITPIIRAHSIALLSFVEFFVQVSTIFLRLVTSSSGKPRERRCDDRFSPSKHKSGK